MHIKRILSTLMTAIIFAIIVVGMVGVFVLAATPVTTTAQGYVGGVMLALMILVLFWGRKLKFRGPLIAPLRIISIFLAIFLTMRYMVWRVEFTIGGY